jgi:hypothetical protein
VNKIIVLLLVGFSLAIGVSVAMAPRKPKTFVNYCPKLTPEDIEGAKRRYQERHVR